MYNIQTYTLILLQWLQKISSTSLKLLLRHPEARFENKLTKIEKKDVFYGWPLLRSVKGFIIYIHWENGPA